jgi:hypothetical protein
MVRFTEIPSKKYRQLPLSVVGIVLDSNPPQPHPSMPGVVSFHEKTLDILGQEKFFSKYMPAISY